MAEWFYDTLQATVDRVDPTKIEPYVWMGQELSRKTVRNREMRVWPCGHTGVEIQASWSGNRLNRSYHLSVEDGELAVTLRETTFNDSVCRGRDIDDHFSAEELRAMAKFDAVVDFDDFLLGLRPVLAKHFVRGAIEEWREAEHDCNLLETGLREFNKDLVSLPHVMEHIKPHLYGPYAHLERERYNEVAACYDSTMEQTEEYCIVGNDARNAADMMRARMIAALQMARTTAPRLVLPVNLEDIGDVPNVGYAMSM